VTPVRAEIPIRTVLVNETAERVAPSHLARIWIADLKYRLPYGKRRLLTKRAVRQCSVVMIDESLRTHSS